MSAKDNDIEENELFRTFVKDVTPINIQTIEPKVIKPKARVAKKTSDNFTASTSKKNTLSNEADSFFAFHLSKKERKSFKAGKVFFEATLDLHGQTVDQSERLLIQFINDCLQQHIVYAMIVHGQGHHSPQGAVLKPAVLYFLSKQDAIEAYCPAQTKDGGQGASYIFIKKT